MFTVLRVRCPFLLWVTVELRAEADMSLTAQRLWPGYGLPRKFVLQTRVLRVKTGESFNVIARKTDRFWAGERVPLDRVADKWPISRKWRTIATL